MKDRIQLIMQSRQLTSARFADDLGVPRSTISHILSGRNKPSLEFVMKVLDSYPEVTAEWLLYGKGDAPDVGSGGLFVGHAEATGAGERMEDAYASGEETEEDGTEGDDVVQGASGHQAAVSGRKAKHGGITATRQAMPDMPPEKVLVFYPDGTFSCHYPRDAGQGENTGKAR